MGLLHPLRVAERDCERSMNERLNSVSVETGKLCMDEHHWILNVFGNIFLVYHLWMCIVYGKLVVDVNMLDTIWCWLSLVFSYFLRGFEVYVYFMFEVYVYLHGHLCVSWQKDCSSNVYFHSVRTKPVRRWMWLLFDKYLEHSAP